MKRSSAAGSITNSIRFITFLNTRRDNVGTLLLFDCTGRADEKDFNLLDSFELRFETIIILNDGNFILKCKTNLWDVTGESRTGSNWHIDQPPSGHSSCFSFCDDLKHRKAFE